MIAVINTGIYHTLISQLDRLARHNRHGSFKTRERYYDAMKRFCAFLADEYRLEKISNISGKHIEAYVERLKERGRSVAYIKTDLSAIRLFHDLIPDPRHRLTGNDSLVLERRRNGDVDRTWTDAEFEEISQQAVRQGHDDYADMLTLIRHTELRSHECARLDTATTVGAARSGMLTVKGKGGKVRSIPINDATLNVLRCRLFVIRRGYKLFVPDGIMTDSVMNGLEQFVIRFRNDDRTTDAKLTIHRLSYTWAAERYLELISAGQSPHEASKKVSHWLGHEWDSVTRIYLAALSADEKRGGGTA